MVNKEEKMVECEGGENQAICYGLDLKCSPKAMC